MILAITLRGLVTFGAWWLLVSIVLGVIVGKWIKHTDDAARQLHEEERQRRPELDELARRRRRRPQR